MATNYESRDIISLGPKFRITTNDFQFGCDGKPVYSLYSYNDTNDVNLMSFSESGTFRIINDRTIEVIAGEKNSDKSVDIVIVGRNGDVTITAQGNGSIRIKGKSVMIEAVEDLDLKAGRNITASCGSGRILMKANKIDQKALTGNAIENTFGVRCFSKVPIGAEYIRDVYVGNVDVNIGIA